MTGMRDAGRISSSRSLGNVSRFRTLAVSGFAVLTLVLCRGAPEPDSKIPSEFDPSIGVCTPIGDAAILKMSGCDYVEEGVRRFLVPDRPEEEFEILFAALGKSSLPLLACNGFLPETLKSVGPEVSHDEIIAFAETAFRRARRSGVNHIVFGSAGSRMIPGGFDRAAARRQFVRLLRLMGDAARNNDLTIVIEPLNRSECNFIISVSEGIDLVREVGHPNIRLLADVYHMLCESEGPESIVRAGDLLRHCHIAEKEGRSPPGTSGEDFRPYFRALKRIGYSGGISIECRWEDLAGQLPRAVASLKEQIAEVNAEDSLK